MRLSLLLALLLGAVLALTGCFESTKDRYVSDYQPLNDRLVKVNQELVEAINTASARGPRRLAGELTPLAGELEVLSRQIADLDTPEDLRQESATLTRRLRRTGRGAGSTAALARRPDRTGLASATTELADQVNGVIRATRRLARATGAVN